MRYWLILAAGGRGRRLRDDLPKQHVRIAGKTLLEHALEPFLADSSCRGIVLVSAADDARSRDVAEQARHRMANKAGAIWCASAGEERCHSVQNGLAYLRERVAPDDWVLVHDAARPCLDAADLGRLLRECADHPVGGLLACPVVDTLKLAQEGDCSGTADRNELWRAQTPQMFRFAALEAALEQAIDQARLPTDESQAIEWQGGRPRIVAGSTYNLKVTTKEDLLLAEAILQQRNTSAGPALRIGQGFDVHAFGPGDSVPLGGVRFANSRGVVAHSDGDVLIHALVDALLGAAGLGDIGVWFPPDDPAWRNAPSERFLSQAVAMLAERGYRIRNVDATIICEHPRIGEKRGAIRDSLARALALPASQINIKATTTERLGFLGRGEGIAAQVVALIEACEP
ncbi:MAG: 2-C-methyl-D-erythritol 4-phosphate cytidylyltransferase [Steroidobacteraceae bacterium]